MSGLNLGLPEIKSNVIVAIRNSFALVERGVSHFDTRFTLRALRSISSLRKRFSYKVIRDAILAVYPPSHQSARYLLRAAAQGSSSTTNGHTADSEDGENAMMVDTSVNQKGHTGKDIVPEVEIYISVLIQVCSWYSLQRIRTVG